jgi:hypothetical protein
MTKGIDQPIEGLMYDLNMLPEQTLCNSRDRRIADLIAELHGIAMDARKKAMIIEKAPEMYQVLYEMLQPCESDKKAIKVMKKAFNRAWEIYREIGSAYILPSMEGIEVKITGTFPEGVSEEASKVMKEAAKNISGY